VASTPTRILTFAEFDKLPEPVSGRYELRHGETVLVPPPKHAHYLMQRRLRRLLEGAAGAQGEVEIELGFRPQPVLDRGCSFRFPRALGCYSLKRRSHGRPGTGGGGIVTLQYHGRAHREEKRFAWKMEPANSGLSTHSTGASKYRLRTVPAPPTAAKPSRSFPAARSRSKTYFVNPRLSAYICG